MEEKVYSRSVTKQAMSGRVVDKMQIDRHYRMNELSELYTFTPCVLSNRPSPLMPTDEILKALLHQYPERAFSYHNHDSLLENKPEQDLSEEEIKEAWQLYEQESRGVPANRPMGGPQMPLLNDLTASMYNANLFAAASSLDSTAGLFQQLYPAAPQTSYPSPFDYLSTLMPFDMSAFRGPLATTSSKTVTPPSASSLLRNQLNTSNMPFSSNPFNFNPSTSITKTTNSPKRRTSAAKQLPPQLSTGSGSSSTSISSNLNNLVSLQQRIIHKNDKNPTTIPLDPEPTAARKSLPFPTKVNPVMTNKVRSNFNMPKPTTKGITSGKPLIPQRLAPNGSQVQRSRSNVSLQTPASNGVIQKSSSLQRVPNNQALQSSGAARTIQVANITKNNSTVIKPIARTSSSPMQQQVTKSPLTISHKTGSSNQSIEMAPVRLTSQKQFKPVVQQKTMPSLMPKIVMQPQHKVPQRTGPALPLPSKNPPLPRPQTLNSISVSKSVQMPQTINSSSVPKSIQMLTNSASPISITKLPLPGSSKVPLKPATTSGGSISLQRIPKIVSSQQQVMSGVQRTQIQSQKRPFEVRKILINFKTRSNFKNVCFFLEFTKFA